MAERWAWHTDVYAFRDITLGIKERVSPCDPKGEWHNEALVADAVARKLRERSEAKRARQEFLANDPETRRNEERYRLADEWRRAHAGELGPKPRRQSTAADLGVTAREYRPTAEQLAEGRRALGLEE